MSKITKKILSVVLTLALVMSAFLPLCYENAYAVSNEYNNLCDAQDMEVIEVTDNIDAVDITQVVQDTLDTSVNDIQDEDKSLSKNEAQIELYEEYIDVVDGDLLNWQSLGTAYQYNRLDDSWQAAYLAVEAMFITYMESTEDYTASDYYASLYVDTTQFGITTVTSDSDTKAQNKAALKLLFNCVYLDNPQYFIIANTLAITSGTGKLYTVLMDDFRNYEDRISAYENFKNGIEDMANSITSTSDYCTVVDIYDAICDKVYYGTNGNLSQCAYSVFCSDHTVCKGYSTSFVILCSYFGIESNQMIYRPQNGSGEGHAFNQVLLNGRWYWVDATWDDAAGGNYYNWFLRDTESFYSNSLHTPYTAEAATTSNPAVIKSVEYCDTDSVGDERDTTPGIIEDIGDNALSPKITLSGRKISITSDNEDAEIYYALSDTKISCALSRCKKYTGDISVGDNRYIKAVCFSKGKKYSESVIYNIKESTLTVNPNGGVWSNTTSVTSLSDIEGFTLTVSNPTRDGYKFTGWSITGDTDSFNNGVYTYGLKNSSTTLTANWQKIQTIQTIQTTTNTEIETVIEPADTSEQSSEQSEEVSEQSSAVSTVSQSVQNSIQQESSVGSDTTNIVAPVIDTLTYKGIKYKILGKELTVLGYSNKKDTREKLIIPTTIKKDGVTYKVTKVAKKAFYRNKYIKKVVLGKNVKFVEAKAFSKCKKLKNIRLKNKKTKGLKSLKKLIK